MTEHPEGGAQSITLSGERSNAQELPAAELATAVARPNAALGIQNSATPQSAEPTRGGPANSGPIATDLAAGANPNAALGIIPSTLSLIERIARDPTIDIDRLERMLAFQERLMQKQAETEFNEAMARLHARLADVRIVKTRSVLYDVDKNDKRKGQAEAFRYTPLDEIDKVVRPLLNEEGMVPTYSTEMRDGGGAVVVARLTHRNGHYREASIPLPLDTTGGKSNVQAMGSTFSYGRRYTLCMLLNIVTLDDDDGMGGPIDAAQAGTIRKLIADASANEAGFLKYMHAESVDAIPFRSYRKAISALEERAQKARAK